MSKKNEKKIKLNLHNEDEILTILSEMFVVLLNQQSEINVIKNTLIEKDIVNEKQFKDDYEKNKTQLFNLIQKFLNEEKDIVKLFNLFNNKLIEQNRE